ncbi:hypothetical protein PVA45_06015 [Entomospira entomophila]|uniref:Uncharacterized protein n=1 Tax=Entomospira entomophila TaxID=2719988 RepID=A0A968KRT6_9SPIO|nr:hypothetical protein [Entomospira entomophilus]NIZ41054.1 hypothetical protein [Entomospira entomophilus]WDI35263.1 hypothetical protein PVA45_06015 [Entomospira entomophilus]
MLTKIRAKLLTLPKAWRIVLLIFLAFLFTFFITAPIIYKLGEFIYKDDWYPEKVTWLDSLIMLVSMPFLILIGKWLKLDEKK